MVLLDNGGCAGEDVRLALPPPDLRQLVEHAWVQRHPEGTPAWRIVPDASPHLIVTVTQGAEGASADVVLVGPRSTMAVIDTRQRTGTVGIRLRPGAIGALGSASARDFVDRAVPLEEALGAAVLRGLELAGDAPPQLLVSELFRAVRRAARAPAPAAIASTLERASRVRGMVDALGVPERTLRDRAVRDIGLGPKRTLRILRLHRALHLARRRDRSWTTIAQMAGYADHAHLTRELRALLDETPSAWRARGSAVSFKPLARELG